MQPIVKSHQWAALVLFVAILRPPATAGADGLVVNSTPAANTAFARYLAGLEQTSPWTLENVEIDASVPKLKMKGWMRAIRRTTPPGMPEYQVLESAGDPAVRQQVIARYLTAERTAAKISAESVAISPANYQFAYKGVAAAGGADAYAFQIKPRRKSAGLIKGELWLDGQTGAPVHLSGYLVKRSSIFIKRIALTRETVLSDEMPAMRTTHLSVDTLLVGSADLMVRETPLAMVDDESGGNLRMR